MGNMFEGPLGAQLRLALMAASWLLVAFLAVEVISGVSSLRYIGAGIAPANTITLSGKGEASGTPDIATFNFSVVSEKPTVAAAQTEATDKINAITKYLKDAGIADKDIQTSDYSVYPQYEYQNAVCSTSYCPPGRQVLKGYQVRQSTTVKVRDTSKAGDLLTGVGAKGATEVSGLTFTFDNPDALSQEARSKAIADAQKKADVLAGELGVRIVRVVGFNESGSNPSPIYYAKDAAGMGGAMEASSAPAISTGENKVVSNVSVTYEIR